MAIEERELAIDQLRPGMYVSRLDRDWEGTPYLLQGFLIEQEGDIARLGQYCSRVTVDVHKSENFVRGALLKLAPRPRYAVPGLKAAVSSQPWPILVPLDVELPRAQAAVRQAHESATGILRALRAGDRLDNEAVELAVAPVVGSILRNPDAFFWLEALRAHDGYSYTHAVNSCALMAAFGRHLGLPDEALRDLAAGGLLMDIGKAALPEELLNREGALRDDELEQVRGHVMHSLRLYDAGEFANPVVREIILNHHEREDGSGYPNGLSGDQIPLFGRIAGIVDSYDAMTSPRAHQAAVSRYEALQAMYRERGRSYQPDLLEQFVQCLGAYPVGTLVELNTGELAIVMAQNPVRRLFPRVMLLSDAGKQRRAAFEPLDLRDTWTGPDPACISIRRGVPPGSFGLDPTELFL